MTDITGTKKVIYLGQFIKAIQLIKEPSDILTITSLSDTNGKFYGEIGISNSIYYISGIYVNSDIGLYDYSLYSIPEWELETMSGYIVLDANSDLEKFLAKFNVRTSPLVRELYDENY